MQISFDLILLRAWQLSCILVRATPVTSLGLLFPSLLFLCSHFKHPNPHCITKAPFLFISRAVTHVDLMHRSFLTHIDCTFLRSSLYAETMYVCSTWEYIQITEVTDFCRLCLIFKWSMQQPSQYNMIFTFATFSSSSDVYGLACSPSPTCGAETRSRCSLRWYHLTYTLSSSKLPPLVSTFFTFTSSKESFWRPFVPLLLMSVEACRLNGFGTKMEGKEFG